VKKHKSLTTDYADLSAEAQSAKADYGEFIAIDESLNKGKEGG